ncbi:MAG TPA: hypothetical protein VIK60_01935 [Vicinamibacterales bacterium]
MPAAHVKVINGDQPVDPTACKTITDLRELIAALDRRVPRVERTSEIDIARDAAALRAKALERIAELHRTLRFWR